MSDRGLSERLRGWVRRHPYLVGFVVFVILLWKVPWYPYTPYCSERWGWTDENGKRREITDWLEQSFWQNGYMIQGTMTEKFAENVARSLNMRGAPAIRIGSTVLMRPLDWVHQDNDQVINANNKSINYILFPDPESNVLWATLPDEMKRRVKEIEGKGLSRVSDDCELTRWLIMENHGNTVETR